MSCNENCNPCNQVLTSQESVASWLDNLTMSLLGTFTKTIVDGRATWSAPCDLTALGLSCWPKSATEGWVCYILRLIQLMGLFVGGTWDNATDYCVNTFVTSGSVSYISLSAVPAGSGAPATRPDLWLAVVGPGPQGPPGPSGAGSAVNYAHRTLAVSDTLIDNDAVVICDAGADIVVTLPQIAATLSGKWFKICVDADSGHNVAITANVTDDIQMGVITGNSITLTPGEAVTLVAAGGTRWYVV